MATRGRPRNRIPTVTVSIQLSRAVKRQAQKLADKEGLALATWVRRLILKALAEAEAAESVRAA